MAYTFQVTFDCRDLEVMTQFWAIALEYQEEQPPLGHTSWAEWAAAQGIPRDQWRGALVDPNGYGPRLFFQPVPERKTAKNRVHLDVTVTRPEDTPAERSERRETHVARCVAAGACVLSRAQAFIVMADPEGNEFCIQ
ncbi:glyoxalase [Arthrobacter sp. MYb211]|uniref:VOC family protein n=1 Tax=unclassified Arthrobacter TaxID=235627 RepID=UPI000CFDEAC2|nr:MULTISPECIES: VOC family protein [unclassified Arthrobacter]PRA13892.1 glyoxalase [Arthrobacter sp. MYb221]PRC09262.1 glyoxalase [Arthrobacter sp. MYb211]